MGTIRELERAPNRVSGPAQLGRHVLVGFANTTMLGLGLNNVEFQAGSSTPAAQA